MNFYTVNRLLGAVLLSGVLVSGCYAPKSSTLLSTSDHLSRGWRPSPDISKLTYTAADGMVAQMKEDNRARQVILPASFVEDKNLDRSSPMGRLLAQQMASRLSQSGYSVLEIKLRTNVRLNRAEGQFVLSREVEKVAEIQRATAVLVGSYVESRSHLFVNSQLILLDDGVVLASQDFKVPLTFELRALLAQKT